MQLGAEVRNGRGADKCIQRADECRKVHTACIQKAGLSTLCNVLIISVVHTKSAECRQFAI